MRHFIKLLSALFAFSFAQSVWAKASLMTITAAEVSDDGASSDSNLSVTFTSSEPTSDFGPFGFTINGGNLSSFAVSSSKVYTATFTASSEGTSTIDVPANSYTSEGEPNNCKHQFNWAYDSTASTLSGVSIASSNTGS